MSYPAYASLGKTTYSAMPLSPGRAGNIQTLQAMAAFVLRDHTDPQVVDAANRVISSLPSGDDKAEADALYNYVKKNIRYRKHPLDAQWVQDIFRTFGQYKSADCTSQSVALATLFAAAGLCPRFLCCNFNYDSQTFDHVLVQCAINGQWISYDPCNRTDGYPGWEPQAVSRAAYEFYSPGQGMGDEVDGSGAGIDWVGDGSDAAFSGDGGGDNVDNIDWESIFFGPVTGSGSADLLNNAGASGLGDPANSSLSVGGGVDTTGAFDFLNQIGQDLGLTPGQDIGSLLDAQLVVLPDGSTVVWSSDGSQETWDANGNVTGITQVNADGTRTFINPQTGATARYDNEGNQVGAPGTVTPAQAAKVAQVKAQGAPAASGGGGGIPLGSSGGQKAATTPTTTPSTTANTLNSIINGVKSALQSAGVIPPTTAGLVRQVNPVTGQVQYINPATGQPVSVGGTGLSTTLGNGIQIGGMTISWTMIIVAIAAYELLKKR